MEQRETSALNRAWNNIFVRLTVLVMLITMLVPPRSSGTSPQEPSVPAPVELLPQQLPLFKRR